MLKLLTTRKQMVILLLSMPFVALVGACETVTVPLSDETDPAVRLTASGPALRGGTAVVDPEGPAEERRIETGDTLVLRGEAEDRDGGVQRVTIKGRIHVFCSSNQDGSEVDDWHEIREQDVGNAGIGDEAPVRRQVTLTLAQEDLTPLCPSMSAFVRSEGRFTTEGENVHGSVVETDEFKYF